MKDYEEGWEEIAFPKIEKDFAQALLRTGRGEGVYNGVCRCRIDEG